MKRFLHIASPIVLFFMTTFLVVSCEKDITVGLPQPGKKPVIDGVIYQGQPARVSITWSFPYFEAMNNLDVSDTAAILNFLVTDAEVYVSDGITTEKLNPAIDPNLFPPFFYKGNSIVGTPGRTYTLSVKFQGNGVEYDIQGVTTIPFPIALDSIAFKPEIGIDTAGLMYMYFQDPPEVGNIYRLFSKRPSYPNYMPTKPIGNSVIDDQAYNGQYIEFLFERPRSGNRLFYTNDDSDTTSTGNDDYNDRRSGLWKRGDTVMVRFCTIDRTSYDYIKTLENSAGTNGNPFSNPTTVKSNLTGGDVLGGWVGYGVFDIQRIAQ